MDDQSKTVLYSLIITSFYTWRFIRAIVREWRDRKETWEYKYLFAAFAVLWTYWNLVYLGAMIGWITEFYNFSDFFITPYNYADFLTAFNLNIVFRWLFGYVIYKRVS